MKKRRTKLRKILIRSLLFLLLLIGLGGVLLRSKTVQTYLAQEAADWLGKQLGVEVRIGALEFDFFRNIHLEEVYLGDKQKDTLIAADAITLELVKYDSKTREVIFDDASLKKIYVNIGYHKGQEDKNIDFLIDFINGPKKPKNTPPKIWSIRFKKVEIKDGDFHYFDEAKQETEKGSLDEFNMRFRNLNGVFKNLDIVDDSLHFKAENVSANERSGMQIKRMDANCNIHYKGMDFTDLDMKTACSHLLGELHFSYPGYKHLDEFVSNTKWRGSFTKSKICLGELSIFTSELQGHKEFVNVRKMNISGTYDHLRISNVDASLADNTRVQGDYYMEGLPDWRNTICDFKVSYLRTTGPDLERILKGTELPSQVHDAGTITLSGDFKGKFLHFDWRGTLNSALGNAATDIAMNLEPGLAKAEFSGRIMTERFDLSKFSSELGVSAMDITLDGKGLDAENFSSYVDARIPNFIIRGRSFSGAVIDGNLTAKNFEGKATFNDLRLNAEFDGNIDFTNSIPVFDFEATTRGLDLYEIGLDTVHTLVWGKVKVKATGFEPDVFQGNILLQDVNVHRMGKVYDFRSQYFSKKGTDKNTEIVFYGDFASGKIEGDISLENVDAIVVNSMADIFPERMDVRKDYHGQDSFRFDVLVHKPAILYDYFVPGIETNALHLVGDYHGASQLAHFDLDQLDLTYGQYKLSNLEVHANLSGKNGLHAEAAALSFYNKGELQLQNMAISADVLHGLAEYNFRLSNRDNEYKVDVDGISRIFKDSITAVFTNSDLQVGQEKWTIDPASKLVLHNDGTIESHYLYLDGVTHYVEVKGRIGKKETDTLRLDLANFGFDFIRPYMAKSTLDSFEGVMTGTMYVTGLFGQPRFYGEAHARDLKYYGVDYGDATVDISDLAQNGKLGLHTVFSKGMLLGLEIDGNLRYTDVRNKDAMNLKILIPKGTAVQVLQPFFTDVLTWNTGTLEGEVDFTGAFEKPDVKGALHLSRGKATIDYLQTSYSLEGDFIVNDKGLFTKRPILMYDETGSGVARARLAITHDNFEDFAIDLKIDSAVNLKCLNTTERDNDLYYGTAWADGDCRIHGPFDKISMDINLKSRKNSKIKLLYSDLEQNELLGYITLRSRHAKVKTDSVVKEEVSNVIHRINITMNVTEDLDAEFVIDKRLGDVIKGKGRGLLRMTYDERENFYLYGTFRVIKGDYIFSLPGINVVTKKIALQPGGTITWTGDPYDALVNITGSFEKTISPSALMAAVGNSKSYPPIKVRSDLYMTGNLYSPEIRFDIQAPELERSTASSANDVYRVIQRIRSDKDETTRQAVALLLFGNFVTPSFAQGAAGVSPISATGVGGNTLSAMATDVVNNIFTNLGIPTRIQLNFDDVRNSAGTENTEVFVSTETFLTNKLKLDLNYDPTYKTLVYNSAFPLNFKLEYQPKNENWRFNAFSRSSNLLLQQSGTSSNLGVSGNTLGVGVIWRRDFETFRPAKKVTTDTTSN